MGSGTKARHVRRDGARPVGGGWRRSLHALVAIAGTFCALGTSTSVQANQKLLLAFVPSNAMYWDTNVAVEKGFFREQGFEAEIVASLSSTQSVQQVVAGAVHIAAAQPETVVSAVERGGAIGIIAAPVNRADWFLTSVPAIKTVEGLKGKTIGLSGLRVGEYWLTQKLLARSGLKPAEYSLLQIGPTPMKYAALEKGSIDAAVLFLPIGAAAEQKGFHTLARFGEIRSYPTPIYFTSPAWARQDGNGKRFAAAITKAHEWLFDPANRDAAITVLIKYSKTTPEAAAATYAEYFGSDPKYTRRGEIDVDGIKRLLQDLAGEPDYLPGPSPAAEKFLIPRDIGGLW